MNLFTSVGIKTIIFAVFILTLSACSSISQKEFGSSYSEDQRQLDGLNIDDFTKAGLKAFSRAHLNASPTIVFQKMADHKNMNLWVPMIDHEVQVDFSKSEPPGANGVGTIRVCDFGGDILTEKIQYWEQNKQYAYSVLPNENVAGVDHLGVITIESDGKGGSLVTWRQYFNPKPWSLKAKIMPFMMSMVMDNALENLSEEYGGKVL